MAALPLLLGLGVALAGPNPPQPIAPPASQGGVILGLLGGSDTWPEEEHGTFDLRLGGGVATARGPGTWSARYGGILQGWQEGYLVDAHLLELGLERPGDLAYGGLVQLTGGALWGWGEVRGAASGQLRRGKLQLGADLGPDLRFGIGGRAGGVGLDTRAGLRFSPRFSAGARSGLRSWWAADFPLLYAEVDLSAAWEAGPRFILGGGLGLTTATGGTAEAWVAGLPPSGLTTLRAWLAPSLLLGHGFRVLTEATAERAGDDYLRARFLVGVSARFGRASRPGAGAVTPPHTVFRLSAPAAGRVEVSGSFSGWAPVAMTRWPDGTWVLELDLPPGEHTYVYLVDGAPETPPEAARRRPDGFGGENGVLVVAGEEADGG
ncbi:MAG: glycogen-binding domain-containing protein [Pseudomonadota bacterium]